MSVKFLKFYGGEFENTPHLGGELVFWPFITKPKCKQTKVFSLLPSAFALLLKPYNAETLILVAFNLTSPSFGSLFLSLSLHVSPLFFLYSFFDLTHQESSLAGEPSFYFIFVWFLFTGIES